MDLKAGPVFKPVEGIADDRGLMNFRLGTKTSIIISLLLTASLLVEERNNGIRATATCPGEVATPILDARPVPVSDEDKARILQSEDVGDLILFVAQQPAHVTLNEILITPTYNRFDV